MTSQRPGASAAALSVLLAGAGAMHLAIPAQYEATVPRWLPGRRVIVYASGAAELVCAAGLWHPVSRRPAALATAGLFVAVFPANVQMALDARPDGSRSRRLVRYARLPLQVPLVWWALRVAHDRVGDAPLSMSSTRRRGATGSASDL